MSAVASAVSGPPHKDAVIDRFAAVDHGKDADYVLNKLLLKEAALISTSKLAISIISSIIQIAKNAD